MPTAGTSALTRIDAVTISDSSKLLYTKPSALMWRALVLTVHFIGLLIQSTHWNKTKDQLPIPFEMSMPTHKYFGAQYPDNLFTSHTPGTVCKENKVAQNCDKSNFFLHIIGYKIEKFNVLMQVRRPLKRRKRSKIHLSRQLLNAICQNVTTRTQDAFLQRSMTDHWWWEW